MTIRSVSPSLLRLLVLPVLLLPGIAAAFEPDLGPAKPFSFETLADDAKALAEKPFEPYPVDKPELFDKIDYDAHWKIVFRPDHTVDVGDAPVQFFHQGRYFKEPVTISLVEDGEAREVLYSADYFTMPEDSPAKAVEDVAGWAGFRVMRPDLKTDWISFLGASYFRTDGPDRQYGLSARALAVNTGLSEPEEFPRFTAFYLEQDDKAPGDNIVIYALLDSKSVTGAYRIEAENVDGEGQVLHIRSKLFFREAVERLGIAPLTSMYWYSETHRNMAFDWRPEVHDSDGLEIINGAGEQIWRPLNNPDRVVTSSFYDENPKGFGLIQRDRNFDHYQDDGVFYNRRASAWIEPEGDWGKGMVQLVELPSDDEIYDNIVAYWLPEDLPQAGDERDFSYTLNWVRTGPESEALAETMASRIGRGGVPGQPRPTDQIKVVVDFAGDAVKGLTMDDDVAADVSVGPGAELIDAYAMPIVGTDDWRLTYDLKFEEEADTVDVRAYLSQDGTPLTETWLGQFHAGQFR